MSTHSPAVAERPSVLVTGAAGFVGARVVELLSQQGRGPVLATDVTTSSKTEALGSLPGVEFRAMDLRDGDQVAAEVRSVDAVVHLAALRLRASDAQPRDGFAVNVSATFNLLAAVAEHGVGAFVYGSSQQLYGSFSKEPSGPMREEDGAVGRDVSMYAAAKLACEAFLPPFARKGGFHYLALRFGSIYGPDAAEHSNSWMMLEALRAVDRGERARVAWSEDSRHSLVHVDDAARAVVRAIDLPLRDVAVNVVSGPTTTGEIYSTLLRLYGADPAAVEFTPDRRRYQLVDNERLRTQFGCAPQTSLETGLQSIVDWHRATSSQGLGEHARIHR